MKKIDFIAAQEGKVVLFAGDEVVIRSADAGELALVIRARNNGDLSGAYCSSSMDFASEDGFDADADAMILLETAIDLA